MRSALRFNEHGIIDVGVVFLDKPGTLMQAGGREWGKEGSKEGNWNGQQFLCRDVAGWILNTHYCSAAIWWAKTDRTGLFKASINQFPPVIDAESALLSELIYSVHTFAVYRKSEWIIEPRCWEKICFVLSVGFLFLSTGTVPLVAQRAKGEGESCQETDCFKVKVLSEYPSERSPYQAVVTLLSLHSFTVFRTGLEDGVNRQTWSWRTCSAFMSDNLFLFVCLLGKVLTMI